MRYRNSECCVTPDELMQSTCKIENVFGFDNMKKTADWNKKDGWHMKNDCENNCDNNCDTDNIMRKLSELQFAAIDLNLFLDTHPCDEAALEMYKKVTKTIESVKMDYVRQYGPLKAADSSGDVPFQWANGQYKWPW